MNKLHKQYGVFCGYTGNDIYAPVLKAFATRKGAKTWAQRRGGNFVVRTLTFRQMEEADRLANSEAA